MESNGLTLPSLAFFSAYLPFLAFNSVLCQLGTQVNSLPWLPFLLCSLVGKQSDLSWSLAKLMEIEKGVANNDV